MKKSEFWVIVILMLIAIGISIASMMIVNNKSSTGITGQATGIVNASMDSMVIFSLSPAVVDFGNISLGQTKSTDSDANPFGISNDGTVKINMTVASSTPLLVGTNAVYQYKSVCDVGGCASSTIAAFDDLTSGADVLIGGLEFDDLKDSFTTGIKIIVPLDEPQGYKTDTLTFTASQA